MADDELADLRSLEQHAVATHLAKAPDAEAIYLDGYNMLHQGLHVLAGYSFGEAIEQRVMMALFIKTLNSLRCFYELATLGYYFQALNLMRTPVEDWMGYWFLRNFPERHEEFTKPGMEPPDFKIAIQAVESAQHRQRKAAGRPPLQPDKRIREWMKQLHKFTPQPSRRARSHDDRRGLHPLPPGARRGRSALSRYGCTDHPRRRRAP